LTYTETINERRGHDMIDAVEIDHPTFCPSYGCGPDEHGNIVHSGPAVTLVDRVEDSTGTITVAPIRGDEVMRDGHVDVYPTEFVFRVESPEYGVTELVLSVVELEGVVARGVRVLRRSG